MTTFADEDGTTCPAITVVTSEPLQMSEVFLRDRDNNTVLLGRKARGWAKGKWFGFGGKREACDASMEDCAVRELLEESGYRICDPVAHHLRKRCTLSMTFDPTLCQRPFEIHVYESYDYYYYNQNDGEIDLDEMDVVRWFKVSELPLEDMILDVRHWLPKMLSSSASDEENKQYFEGKFQYHTLDELQSVEWV
eukprot:PhM_4_TR16253/c0_g1_i1/m.49290/K17816/NUDT1, MTH1; 8-oxo-dGTP diphosphatase / 2-hydroxy-dATP diphosphatase